MNDSNMRLKDSVLHKYFITSEVKGLSMGPTLSLDVDRRTDAEDVRKKRLRSEYLVYLFILIIMIVGWIVHLT